MFGFSNQPSVYTLRQLRSDWVIQTTVGLPDGSWVPARPLGFSSLRRRLVCAWLAFTGQCDLVRWPGNQ